MKILRRPGRDGGLNHWVLIFGLGQIGSAAFNSLATRGFRFTVELPFNWNDSAQRSSETRTLLDFLNESANPEDRFSVLWSAGTCGFHSGKDEADAELTVFQDVIQLCSYLEDALSHAELDFHLVSSAGGLFEDQRVIVKDSVPRPLRQYGHLKMEQEQIAHKAMRNHSLTIYRPSSVYGPMVQDIHRGLINNLIRNARNGRTTNLDSQVMSLRDYVFSGDIGKYIGHRIELRNRSNAGRICFLVSSRCSSIFEVAQKIRKILNLNVYYTLDDRFGNNSDITFHPSVMPPDWQPATLDYGIRQFAVQN